jgi:hypothetical protein
LTAASADANTKPTLDHAKTAACLDVDEDGRPSRPNPQQLQPIDRDAE